MAKDGVPELHTDPAALLRGKLSGGDGDHIARRRCCHPTAGPCERAAVRRAGLRRRLLGAVGIYKAIAVECERDVDDEFDSLFSSSW